MAEPFSVIRALHILFAILWAGAAVYRARVVEASLDRQGFRDAFFARGAHGPFMGVASLGTIAFGGAIFAFGEYSMDALGTGPFVVLMTSVTAATVAFLVGVAGHLPTDIRIKPLAQATLGGDLEDEAAYGALQRREAVLGRVSMALIGIAMLGMVGFRLV